MRYPIVLAAILVLGAVPAHAEITASSDNGFVTTHDVEVSTDPDATFAMLRAPAKWWSAEHSWTGDADNFYMDAQATGCFCELIPASTPDGSRGSVEHMHIVYSEPGKMLRMVGALGPLQSEAVTGSLTITLTPSDAGTKIRFEYVVGGYMRFPMETIAAAVDGVIGEQASRLSMVLGPVVAGPDAGNGVPEDDADETADSEAVDDGVGEDSDAAERPSDNAG
ncbi:MAG: SRPBCC family protein [Pseudomonadota bacterium]